MYIYQTYINKIILLFVLMSSQIYAQIEISTVDLKTTSIEKKSVVYKKFKSKGTNISLGNYVWFDHNKNGLQDLGELGMYGIKLNLYNNADCSGDIIESTRTSDVGYYVFNNIVASSTQKYCISLEYPAHWKATLTHASANEDMDSNLVDMDDNRGKIENISIVKTDYSLDAGLHHKNPACQIQTLKVGMTGNYDNSKSWAKRAGLNVAFENLVASGFCHEFNNHGPQTGESFSVHLEDRLGFSKVQRDRLSRVFRFMSDPEVLILIENTFDTHDRHFWLNVVSNSFVWYYSDWNAEFNKIEKYIETSSWSEKLSLYEKDGLVNIAKVIIDKTEGLNSKVQYKPMNVYYLWNEDNDKRQDIIVPETSLIPNRAECIVPVNSAKLGNFVWFDANKNGKQDKEELGLSSVYVDLYNARNELISSVKTDANGSYIFNDLEEGKYYVAFVPKNGWTITEENAKGVDKAFNSDANIKTGKTLGFILNTGDENFEIDAGMYLTPQPRIEITKVTNGGDVGNIVEGDVITWTYVVSNKGNAVLTNLLIEDDKEGVISTCTGGGSLEQLNPTKSITCTKVGKAILGHYTNSVMVQAYADEMNVTAKANSSYMGKATSIETGTIGDYVWLDSNHNGVQEGDELPLSGVGVKLFDSVGKEISATFTNTLGKYLFKDVIAGKYYIRFTIPSGYTVTLQNKNESSKDSDTDTSGKTATFTLNLGEDKTDIDMGLYPTTVKLGNRVWYDTNKNGIQDAKEKEKNIAGIGVKLYKENGELVAETKTRDSGYYHFLDVIAGEYYVVFDIPNTYEVSPKNKGSNRSSDSDADRVTGKTELITLVAGIDNPTIDMGLYQELAKVGDRVWYDTNKNGIQDAGESGVGDVEVKLYRVGEDAAVAVTKTASTGIYLFDKIIPGEYYIVFKSPVAYTITDMGKGRESTDSNADEFGRTTNFILSAGAKNSTIDMGVYQNMVSFGDRVWLDTNHDGLQSIGEAGVRDVNVTLFSATSDFSTSVLTDENGNYLFTHLPAGEYSAEFQNLPYGHLITKKDVNGNDNDLNDSDVFVNADEKIITEVTLLTPSEHDVSWDMGIYKTVCLPGKAILGNLVWEDFNKNGIQDIGERGVANIKVTLFNNDTDEAVAEVSTDENGLYEFAHIDPEFNYYVQFTVPNGYVVSLQYQDDEVTDSDTDEKGKSDVITLKANQINSTVDMGIYHKGSTIGDRVWYDEKGGVSNGIQDDGEQGVYDLKVILYNTHGDEVQHTLTNASGEYHFTNVARGTYVIQFFELPKGYIFTKMGEGEDKEKDSNVKFNGRTQTISVNGIHNIIGIDAGIREMNIGISSNDIKRALMGQNVTIDILANDREGTYGLDSKSVKILSVSEGAILSDDGKMLRVPGEGIWRVDVITGAITFSPEDGFIGDPTMISYGVEDTHGNEITAEVNVNYPPIANDDYVNGEVAKQVVIHVTDNDTNTSSPLDKASVRIINPSNNDEVEILGINGEGTWSTNSNGTITFTPEDGFKNNPSIIKYTIKEQEGDVSNRAKVSIVYPDAVDDTVVISSEHEGNIMINVVSNDSKNIDPTSITLGCKKPGSDTLTVNGEGVWSVGENGNIIFTPEVGFKGEPTDIKYTVALLLGGHSNCANIDIRYELLARDDRSTMNVGGVSIINILSNDFGEINAESVFLIIPLNALEGITVSEDRKTLSVPNEGIWSVNSKGVVRFIAEDGFISVPTPIRYSVENNDARRSNEASITLLQGGTIVLTSDSSATANGSNPIVIDVLNNDIGDLNGSSILLVAVDGGLNREILVEGEGRWSVENNRIVFTPEIGYIGTPTPISYLVRDRYGNLSNQSTVRISGTCTCEVYDDSIPSMGAIAISLFVLLTLLFGIFLFRKEESTLEGVMEISDLEPYRRK